MTRNPRAQARRSRELRQAARTRPLSDHERAEQDGLARLAAMRTAQQRRRLPAQIVSARAKLAHLLATAAREGVEI